MRRIPKFIWLGSSGGVSWPFGDESLIPITEEEADDFAETAKALHINKIFRGPYKSSLFLSQVCSAEKNVPVFLLRDMKSARFPGGEDLQKLRKKLQSFSTPAEFKNLWLTGCLDDVESPQQYSRRIQYILERMILPEVKAKDIPLIIGDQCLFWAFASLLESISFNEASLEHYPLGSFKRFDTDIFIPF